MSNRLVKLRKVEAVVGLEIDWRDCYGGTRHQEAYIKGTPERAKLKKVLGKPVLKRDGDQAFWEYKINKALNDLSVKELYVEKYRQSSVFLVVVFKR